MNSRDGALIGVLLAAGTLLQYFISPLGLLLTPDVITAFFCLGIVLIRPKIHEALGIGIAAGFLSMLVPGSILPWANLVSGTAGAFVCSYFYESFRDGHTWPRSSQHFPPRWRAAVPLSQSPRSFYPEQSFPGSVITGDLSWHTFP